MIAASDRPNAVGIPWRLVAKPVMVMHVLIGLLNIHAVPSRPAQVEHAAAVSGMEIATAIVVDAMPTAARLL